MDKWGTSGVLALALEVAGEQSSLTLVSEVKTSGALRPKFGATLSLSPSMPGLGDLGFK